MSLNTATILPEYFYELFAKDLRIETPKSPEEKAKFWEKYHAGSDLFIPEDAEADYLVSCHETAWLVDNNIRQSVINESAIRIAHTSWLEKRQ